MTHGLDTSVVMRLLTGDPPDQAEAAAAFLTESKGSGDRLLVTDLVIAEVYFALHSKYKVPKAEALLRLQRIRGKRRGRSQYRHAGIGDSESRGGKTWICRSIDSRRVLG